MKSLLRLGTAFMLGTLPSCRAAPPVASSAAQAPRDTKDGPPWTHAIVVDAGSSGSRATLFRLEPGTPPGAKPWPVAVPGASTEGIPPLTDDDPEPLVEAIARLVADDGSAPPHQHTALFVWATGGMRALPADQASAIVGRTRARLGELGFAALQVEIISGEREASLALAAARALQAREPELAALELGIVEVGGASAQLAFDDVASSVAGRGLEAMMETVAHEPDFAACFNPGAPMPVEGTGRADPERCIGLLEARIEAPTSAPPDGITWIGLSNLDYVADAMRLPERTTVGTFETSGRDYCVVPWTKLAGGHGSGDARFLARYCFAALYAYVLLTRGFGLTANAEILPRRELGGLPVSWTFGALMQALEAPR